MLGHILIVDDDSKIRELLKRYLQQSGYAVSTAHNTSQADEVLAQFTVDVIILDVMMPVESGPEFLKRRGNPGAPVIMLSALGHVDDRIGGLESGADDYLTKPFEPKELLLRISKLIQRTAKLQHITFGDFEYDLAKDNLTKNGVIQKLTPSEKKILRRLAQTPNQGVSKDSFGFGQGYDSRAVDTQIARLRSKLEDDARNPQFIQTVRGQGYMLWCSSK